MGTHCGIVAVAALLVAAPAACSGQPAAAQRPGAEGCIEFTATSAELERRDRPVHRDDQSRFAIEGATGGRAFEHRLRDFNNLAGTSHDDIGRVQRTARERAGSRLVQSAR